MKIKALIDEDFTNYKEPVMFIGTISCNGKCCKEAGLPITVCQNSSLNQSPVISIPAEKLITRYLENDITTGICFGGLEPLEQFGELLSFIRKLREDYHCSDTVIIYTGFYPQEITEQLSLLEQFQNIIVKFGRYIPNDEPKYDDVLGITLASKNQYAIKIS